MLLFLASAFTSPGCGGESASPQSSIDAAVAGDASGGDASADGATDGGPDAASLEGSPSVDAGQPWLVASGQVNPSAIVLDSVNIYWLNDGITQSAGPKVLLPSMGGSIASCPFAGCGGAPRTLVDSLVTNPYQPRHLATDGANVYFDGEPPDAGPGLFTCAVGGCSDMPQWFVQGAANGVAAAGGSVYWLGNGEGTCEALSCPAAGCPATPGCVWSVPEAAVLNIGPALVVDNGFAYWMDLFGNVSQCALPNCGDQPNAVMGPITAAAALAAGGGFVYAADGNPLEYGAIYQCPVAGCPQGPVTIATGLSGVTAIAADAAYVYWTELGDTTAEPVTPPGEGLVRRCPVTGCNGAPETVASNLTAPMAIAVGPTVVAWVEQGSNDTDGRVWAMSSQR